MLYTRRDFGRLALSALPATLLKVQAAQSSAQAKPNSIINGVHIGAITYSYRSMPDQSAEATLRYIVDSGISAIELMSGPAESFTGAPSGGRGGVGGGGGRGGRGRGQLTPEQQAAQESAQREARDNMKKWRLSVSMDKFKALRKMYNDAGVNIFAWKCMNPAMSDEELEYVFNVANALGCTHTTLELTDDVTQLERIGAFGEKHKIYAAYHTHTQGSMTAFDRAFAASKANTANVDFGHYVAGTGESPIPFLMKFHDRISSFHLKDRTTPAHGAGNLPWGTGDTPLKEILQTLRKNRWRMPATIELEYQVPDGSDAVKEVGKCLQYCKDALA